MDFDAASRQTMRLGDGRALGYGEYGDLNGHPCMFFHGTPGSRYQASILNEPAGRCGIRVIAPERPGYGLSDFLPGRGFTDWAKDVGELADHLGLSRFAVMGVSGGGGYACACAAVMPERLTSVVLVAAMGPATKEARQGMRASNRFGMAVFDRAPGLAARMLKWNQAQAIKRLSQGKSPESRGMAKADREMLRRPEVLAWFLRDYTAAGQRGIEGRIRDLENYCSPWEFRLVDVGVRVSLFHGEQDTTVPVAVARKLAAAIPHCEATYFPGEGHLFLFDHREETLRPVAEL
ncbi:MAG: alpha/beta hydrolase [Actinomycetota bacterium]